jgi:hypothetical protein
MTPAEFAALRRSCGLCPECSRERGDKSRCPTHLAVHRDRERARRARVTIKKREEKAA